MSFNFGRFSFNKAKMMFEKNQKLIKTIFFGATAATITQLYVNSLQLQEKKKQQQKQRFVYAWGWGNFGQLGIGTELSQYLPQKISDLDNLNIVQVATKKAISSALCQNGKVFTWGKSKGGALGYSDNTSVNVMLPKQVQVPLNDQEKIVQLACGQTHMAAVTDLGEVLTWGNPDHGKLGYKQEVKDDKQLKKFHYQTRQNLEIGQIPQKVQGLPDGVKIKEAACGYQHTILLSDNGQVFSFGLNRKGILGYKCQEDHMTTPKVIEALKGIKIVKIDAGSEYSMALSEDGKLYSWGNNEYGQLGNQSTMFQEIPQQVAGFQGQTKIIDFSCGDNFVGAITQEGKLYTWGFGNDGQLGHSNRQDVYYPKMVEFNQQIKQVSCGGSHVGVVTKNDELFMFGRGKEGQLGRGESIESEASYRTNPRLVEHFKGKKVVQVKCGGEHTLAIIEQ